MKRTNFGSIVVAFALAFAGGQEVRAHSGNVIEGTLTHLVGDANPHLGLNQGAIRLFSVRADDGHDVFVDLSATALPDGGIGHVLNRRVRITANPGVQADALPAGGRFPANTLEILPPPRGTQQDVFPLAGNRKYLSILCKWPEVAGEPRTSSFFSGQLGNTYPGFNHYFQETSYGNANINGSGATAAWVTMPHPRSFYYHGVNDGTYLQPMAQACANAAHAAYPAIDFSTYAGLNIMFNGAVDGCCAWGGRYGLTIGAVSQSYSLTWMPYYGEPPSAFGWLAHGVLAHELSHSFNSPHSDDPGGDEYGVYWDVVSAPAGNFAACPTAPHATYGCVGQHQIGNHKLSYTIPGDFWTSGMDFIDSTRLKEHPAGGAAATYTIERMAQPPNVAGTYQLLKVNTGNVNKYYTVESRTRIGYDVNLPGDGVLIAEVKLDRPTKPPLTPPDPVKGNPVRFLAPGGTGAGGALGMRWDPGTSYVNVAENIQITVVSFDAATGNASITAGPLVPPAYTFIATASNVAEGAASAVNIAVTRGTAGADAGSIVWTTSDGTALAGTDFGTLGSGTQKTGTLTWAAGTGGTKNITVGLAGSNIPIINDAGVVDGSKTFTITLSSPVGGDLGAQLTHTVTRLDSDSTISFTTGAANVNEIGPNINLTISRTGSTAVAQSVTFATANGTAIASGDYTTTSGTITFGVGETSKTIALGPVIVAAPYIRIIDDVTVEAQETFSVNLSAPTLGAALGATTSVAVTILSNEDGVSMATATQPGVNEGSGVINVVANRGGSVGAVDVNYGFTNGTALNGTHYTGVPGTLHWNDGESGPKNIPVTIANDGAPNAARTFTVTLSGATGATLSAPMATSVSIADNDNTVQFSAPTAVVAEGTANLVLSVTRTGVTAGQAAQVTWTANNGSALAGTDFGILGNPTPPTGTLNWAAADAVAKSITIPILNDVTLDGAQTFTVSLSAPVGPNLTIGANPVSAVTLNDNDKGLAFALPTYLVTEGTPPNTVTLSVARIGPTTTTATATWATVNGTAESGKDFGLLNNLAPRTGTLSWAAGDATNKTIVIPILNDTIGGEGAETFTVTLTPGAGYVLGAPGTATVTITDDDIPPQSNVVFSQPKYLVMESGPNAVLTLNRVDVGGGFALPASVRYSTVAGTAVATSDYTTATNVLVSWAAFDSAPKNISIPIVNNTIAEPSESFRVVLSQASPGLGIAAPGEATVSIIDDDEAFPLDGVIPTGFSTPVASTKGWHVSNDPAAYEGVFALKSDEIDDSETAGIEMAGTFAAGNVTFRVKVSSEPGFDRLTFFVDGVPQPLTWSGTAVAGWTASPTYPLTAGVHTLRWVYSKDASVSVGLDAAYIDGLATPSFTP